MPRASGAHLKTPRSVSRIDGQVCESFTPRSKILQRVLIASRSVRRLPLATVHRTPPSTMFHIAQATLAGAHA